MNIMKTINLLFPVAILFVVGCTKTPQACFVADKGKVAKVNEEVQFDASCSTNATSYSWDFGDGTAASEGASVKHKYSTAAIYNVKLTAKNKRKENTSTVALTIN